MATLGQYTTTTNNLVVLVKYYGFLFRRGLTVKEAIDILTGADETLGIEALYITPPEASTLTDEDSGEEDGEGLVDNLSGRQLLADAEIRLSHDFDEGPVSDDPENFPENDGSDDVVEVMPQYYTSQQNQY